MSNLKQRPDNNMVWAILTTVFCCLPLGIVSVVYAAKVDGLYRSGDYEAAVDAATNSKKYARWGAIIGFVVIVITTIIDIMLLNA